MNKLWLSTLTEQLDSKNPTEAIKITAAMAEKLQTAVVLGEIFLFLLKAVYVTYDVDYLKVRVFKPYYSAEGVGPFKEYLIKSLEDLQTSVYGNLANKDCSLKECLGEIAAFIKKTQEHEKQSFLKLPSKQRPWTEFTNYNMPTIAYALLGMSYQNFLALTEPRTSHPSAAGMFSDSKTSPKHKHEPSPTTSSVPLVQKSQKPDPETTKNPSKP